jgi:serine/threonine protein phosphatase PrpC
VKVPARFLVGACSHPGQVRRHNEDDYLVGTLPGERGLLAAIADGMGGLAGGAEASRTALRALAGAVLDGGSDAPVDVRLRAGSVAAAARVQDAAAAVPALRDMGTTLTALCCAGDRLHLVHVGDTRAYRLRAGRCELLTEDHAVRQPDNLLTRCIGAGQPSLPLDEASLDLLAGDRLLLVSDGVWSVVAADEFGRLAALLPPQAAAEALVEAALRAGGPDNATAVVVEVAAAAAGAPLRDVDLPRHERPDDRQLWPSAGSLRPPRWPWWLLAAATVVAADVACRLAGGPGLPFPWPGFGR